MTIHDIPPSGAVHSFRDIIDAVGHINISWKERWGMDDPGFCFRGCDDQTYSLNPSILRDFCPTDLEQLALLENNIWTEFRVRSIPLLGRHVSNAWEALLIAQQHGLPTRFLDWSRNIAVAAYFAVRDIQLDDKDGAIWLMAGRHLMELRSLNGFHKTVIGDPNIASMGVRDGIVGIEDFNEQEPIVIQPDQVVPRIVAQGGIYTLHTFRKYALEMNAIRDREQHGDGCYLHKLIVPSCCKDGIRSELSLACGISEETVFPDLDGFARSFLFDLKRRFSSGRFN